MPHWTYGCYIHTHLNQVYRQQYYIWIGKYINEYRYSCLTATAFHVGVDRCFVGPLYFCLNIRPYIFLIVTFRFQAFREALPLAERLEGDMSTLENWLEDKTSEVRRKEEAGFPEDVDAEIKWNKVG